MLEGTQLCLFPLKCVCGHADPEFNYSPLPFGCTDSVCLHSIPQLKPQMLTTHSPERCFPFSVLTQSPTSFLKHPQWQCFTGSDRQPSSSFTSSHILLLYHSLRSRSCFSHSLLSNLWLQLQLPFPPLTLPSSLLCTFSNTITSFLKCGTANTSPDDAQSFVGFSICSCTEGQWFWKIVINGSKTSFLSCSCLSWVATIFYVPLYLILIFSPVITMVIRNSLHTGSSSGSLIFCCPFRANIYFTSIPFETK